MGTSGIYFIVNLINNKLYVGSAINLRKRWIKHRSNLRLNKHYNEYLQNAWNKYGEENFEFYVIEFIYKDELRKREQYWIEFSKSYDRKIGYNYKINAETKFGYKHTKEAKLKISIALSKRIISNETRTKLSLGRMKINRSDTYKENTSKAQKKRQNKIFEKLTENPFTVSF